MYYLYSIRFKICVALWMLTVFLVVESCQSGGKSGLPKFGTQLPSSFGSASDLNILTDSSIWRSEIGDSLRYYFERYYPILPQREPYFNVRFFSPDDLIEYPTRKELTNFVIPVDLTDESSPTTQMVMRDLDGRLGDTLRMIKGSNKWARDQLVLYVPGRGRQELLNNLKKYKEIINRELLNHEKPLVENKLYSQGRSRVLQKMLSDSFGFQMEIPKYFKVAIQDDGFLWLRGDTEKVNRNVMITRVPYDSTSQLRSEYMQYLRDSLGKEYIATTIEGSFMLINDEDLPMMLSKTEIASQYALSLKGIWEMENDFLGGPFESFLVMTPDRKSLIFIDFFIHAPSKPKRDLMKELVYMKESMSFDPFVE